MLKVIGLRYILALALLFVFVAPVYAQVDDWTKNSTGGASTGSGGGTVSTGSGGGTVSTGNGGGTISTNGTGKLTNLITAKTLDEFIIKIIEVLLVFAVPIIVLYIMYAGYLFVTAGGEASQISQARTALLYALVGGVIVLGANLIIEVIKGTVKAF